MYIQIDLHLHYQLRKEKQNDMRVQDILKITKTDEKGAVTILDTLYDVHHVLSNMLPSELFIAVKMCEMQLRSANLIK